MSERSRASMSLLFFLFVKSGASFRLSALLTWLKMTRPIHHARRFFGFFSAPQKKASTFADKLCLCLNGLTVRINTEFMFSFIPFVYNRVKFLYEVTNFRKINYMLYSRPRYGGRSSAEGGSWRRGPADPPPAAAVSIPCIIVCLTVPQLYCGGFQSQWVLLNTSIYPSTTKQRTKLYCDYLFHVLTRRYLLDKLVDESVA